MNSLTNRIGYEHAGPVIEGAAVLVGLLLLSVPMSLGQEAFILGPILGGFVAGYRTNAGPSAGMVAGLRLGGVITILTVLVAITVGSGTQTGHGAGFSSGAALLVGIPFGAFIAFLCAVGGFFGGVFSPYGTHTASATETTSGRNVVPAGQRSGEAGLRRPVLLGCTVGAILLAPGLGAIEYLGNSLLVVLPALAVPALAGGCVAGYYSFGDAEAWVSAGAATGLLLGALVAAFYVYGHSIHPEPGIAGVAVLLVFTAPVEVTFAVSGSLIGDQIGHSGDGE